MAEIELTIFPLTENEIKLITIIRTLHPFEKVVINADKGGKVDNFLVERSYKVVLSTPVV